MITTLDTTAIQQNFLLGHGESDEELSGLDDELHSIPQLSTISSLSGRTYRKSQSVADPIQNRRYSDWQPQFPIQRGHGGCQRSQLVRRFGKQKAQKAQSIQKSKN